MLRQRSSPPVVPIREGRPWGDEKGQIYSLAHPKGNVFYTVFERMVGYGRQEKKKYAAVYDIS